MARFYKNSDGRNKWLAKRFKDEFDLSESVLDVGCYNADLKQYLKKTVSYIGIDIAGKPSKILNLDDTDRLPFE